jgi:hypothetical protein
MLFGAAAQAQKKPLQPGEVALAGKLTRVMGIGGETTGWSLELKTEKTIEGQKLTAIEVSGFPRKLEKLVDQEVRARGFVKHHHGVERKDWLVLELTGIHARQAKPAPPAAPDKPAGD